MLERRGRGLASIPEDRIAEGLATGASVAENLVATKLGDKRYVRNGLLDLKAIQANAQKLIERFSIRVGGPNAAVGTLSGGNMQKVVVARELAEQPQAAAGQPADARRRSRRHAVHLAHHHRGPRQWRGGAAELGRPLSELLALSDRLVVLYRGRIVAAFLNRDGPHARKRSAPTCSGLRRRPPEEMKVALR